MAAFRINYSRVMSQVDSMNNLSNNLNSEIRKLYNMLNELKSNWKGPASTAYQRQLNKLIVDMERTRGKMVNVAGTIGSVARRIQLADERAAERAKKFSSGNAGFGGDGACGGR